MKTFYYKFKVGDQAIDVNRHANNAYYLIWMQEAADAHSKTVGDFIEENLRNGFTWMARRNEINYLGQLFLGDEVTIKTWTELAKKTMSQRFIEFIKEDKIVAKAVTDYIFFDVKKIRPVAIPQKLIKLYED